MAQVPSKGPISLRFYRCNNCNRIGTALSLRVGIRRGNQGGYMKMSYLHTTAAPIEYLDMMLCYHCRKIFYKAQQTHTPVKWKKLVGRTDDARHNLLSGSLLG